MKSILTHLLYLSSCFTIFDYMDSPQRATDCYPITIVSVNNYEIKDKIINSKWQYQYSFSVDTCIRLNNTVRLPYKMVFYECDNNAIKALLPIVYNQRKKNVFENVCWTGLTDKNETIDTYYPILINQNRMNDKYAYINNYGEKYKFTYRIMSIKGDTLLLNDGIRSPEFKTVIANGDLVKIYHFYLRSEK